MKSINSNQKQLPIHKIFWIVGIGSLVMLISSILRHELFNSSGDLAFFDQGVYLISRGQTPITSILGFHLLADHAAWILYFISILYKLSPSIYWLFAIQAVALAAGSMPLYLLAQQAGLNEKQAMGMVAVYLLYPVIYNSNLADFHPDTIAVPALLFAVLAARSKKIIWFCLSVLIVLGCKAVLALTVLGMGVWLLFFEGRRFYGLIAIISGMGWFLIANKLIIPFFGNESVLMNRHLYRYSYFGTSLGDTIQLLFTHPQPFLSNFFSLLNLEYLVLLFVPVIWGLRPKFMTPLIAAIPCLALNLLADHPSQKNLVLHYSLPIIPFLMLALIASLAAKKAWIFKQRYMVLWALINFAILGKFWLFTSTYLNHIDNLPATRAAIDLIEPTDRVFTTDIISPHLTHRPVISYQFNRLEDFDRISDFDHILLNTRHPGWAASPEMYGQLLQKVQQQSDYKLKFNQEDVYLFSRQ
jgi:uncharacterized membrane protein